MMANAMLLLSIALEAAIAIIAVLAARKQRPHLYGFALTFTIYVFYDLAAYWVGTSSMAFCPACFSSPPSARSTRCGAFTRSAPDPRAGVPAQTMKSALVK
jgi:hypothetical protein